jgi:DNA invertase Pin-like site-specific DNA recombinase
MGPVLWMRQGDGRKARRTIHTIAHKKWTDGGVVSAVIGAVGRAEREAMLERQREGIAKAQRDGKYKGRAPTVRKRPAEIVRLKDAGVTPSEVVTRLGYRPC